MPSPRPITGAVVALRSKALYGTTGYPMEVNHMETTMNELLPDKAAAAAGAPQPDAASRATPRTGRSGDDVVRWAEFRLAVWAGPLP